MVRRGFFISQRKRHLMPDNYVRTMPSRNARIELEGDYAGWYFVARTSIKMKELKLIKESDDEAVKAHLSRVVTEWNFVDEKGKELPLGLDGLDECNTDLVTMMLSAYLKEVQGVSPN